MGSRRLAWLGAVLVCRGLRRLGAALARGLLRCMVDRRVGPVLLAVARRGRCRSGRKFPGARGETFTCTAAPAAPTTPSAASAAAAFGTFPAPFTGWPRALVRTSQLRARRLGQGVALALTVVAVDVALADTLAGALAGAFAGAFPGALAATLGRRFVPPAAVAIAITLAMIAPAIPVASVAATVALTACTVGVTAVAGMLTATVASLSVITPWSAGRAGSAHLRRRLGRLWSRRLASEHPLEA
jgi:hypothetical protein